MVNPLKGEVELVAGEKTYVLRLGTNALIEIQTVLGGVKPDEIGPRLVDPATRPETIRAVLWGALGGSRSGLSLFDVGDMIDAHPEPIGKAIGEVLGVTFPDGKDAAPGNPRKAAAGTGKRSSKAGSHSASQRKPSGR